MNSPPTCTRDVTVSLESGLHLTPCNQIVELAKTFHCELRIRKGEKIADGRSMLDLMTLAAEFGETLRVEGLGDGAEQAVGAIVNLFERGFPTPQGG
jgi:phosphotransferase system HPr (HPr) family protein